MQMRKRTAWFAAIAVSGAMAGVGLVPALAAPADPPTVSITAQSSSSTDAPVGSFIYVNYHGGTFSQASISGDITGAAPGEVIELFAQTFPFKTAATEITSSDVAGTDVPYQFTVAPNLATTYTAELFASSSAPTPLAVSSSVTVYSSHSFKTKGGRQCARPVCHETFHVYEYVARSALRTEMRKKVYVYFGIRFSRTGFPAPKEFVLGAGDGHSTKPRRINSHEYEFTLTYSFRIGDRGYHWGFNACQKDTESKDGFNLPGHHDCGKRAIGANRVYIGRVNGSPAGLAAQAAAGQ
jgi:hypothetical protein